MQIVMVIALVVSVLLAAFLWQRNAVFRRESHIRGASFPRGLFDKLKAKHPHLTNRDCQLVAHGLRQFFLAHLKSGRQFVSMPSQVVDDLWHELILCTRHYQDFCDKSFGRFLHHTPAAVLSSHRKSNEGLRRCWWYACKEENINPRTPARLPLLFALDAKLNIASGFRYVTDCSGIRREGEQAGGGSTYCGADFASDAVDGSTDGFSDDSPGSGESGDGGSDGCGGGGCGGGD